MARKFFYICAGMFLLALSYHFGASTATAQAPSNSVVGVSSIGNGAQTWMVMTANGDCYVTPNDGQLWYKYANCFTGGPTPALHESWGQMKSRYSPKSAPTSQPATDR